MSDLSCANCGAALKNGDEFCRSCGKKIEAGEGDILKEIFCPNCGNSLRPGARFCDLCGSPCAKTENSPAPAGKPRGRKKKKGCLFKFLALVFLCAIIGAFAFALHGYVLKEGNWRDLVSRIWTRGGGNQPGSQNPPAPSANEASSDAMPPEEAWGGPPRDSRQAEPEQEESAPMPARDDAGVPKTASRNGEEPAPESANAPEPEQPVENGPSSDVAPEIVLASPVSSEPDPAQASPDLTGASPGTVSQAEEVEYVWSSQDADGYSSPVATDRFFTSGVTLSLLGTVSGDRVRMRAEPNTKSRIKLQFDNGVSLDVTRRYSSGRERHYWVEASLDGETGWVYGEFLKVGFGGSDAPEVVPRDTQHIAPEPPTAVPPLIRTLP
jgi:predicted RNA-binding Zn-ribbon protein involved in translation (DUF1610 family)